MKMRRIANFAVVTTAATFLLFGCGKNVGSAPEVQSGRDSSAAQARHRAEIPWAGSFEEALATARQTGKPIMVDFFATWCGPCKLLDSHTYADPLVIREAAGLVAVKVDVDQYPALARQYGIRSVPTIVFLNARGQETSRITGFMPAEGMVQRIQQTLTLHQKGA